MILLFQPDNKKCEIEREENLLSGAEKAGVLIDGSCGGAGICGKCKIRVISGTVSPLTEKEKEILTEEELKKGYRLACLTYPVDDLVLELPGTHKGSSRKKDMAALPEGFEPEPLITKIHRKVKRPSMKDQRSDFDRIEATFEIHNRKIDRELLGRIHGVLEEKRGDVTGVFRGNRLIALEAGDTEDFSYGMAFDIGTTTVVAMLWDLKKAEVLGVTARTNPQSIYGADVISRFSTVMKGKTILPICSRRFWIVFGI